jgi:hypothetical protein
MAEQTWDAGWYPDGRDQSGKTLRYWNGKRWTDQVKQADTDTTRMSDPATMAEQAGVAEFTDVEDGVKAVIFAIALGFGATGAAGFFGIPILAYYFPLGFGMAGVAVGIAGYTMKGSTPWWAWIAIAASIGAIIQGVIGYNDYQDIQDRVNDLQSQF